MSARSFLVAVGTMAFLAAGTAFAFQAVRKQSDVALRVPAAVAPVEAALPEAPVAQTVTPLTARPVRTVSITEQPGATPEATSEGDHIGSQDTTDVASTAAPDAAPDEERRPSSGASPSPPASTVASLVQEEQSEADTAEQAAPSDTQTKPSHARKGSSHVAKQARKRAKRDDKAAAAQGPEPSHPADQSGNEFHSPIETIGKLFSGAQ
jgi:hypothetical protein